MPRKKMDNKTLSNFENVSDAEKWNRKYRWKWPFAWVSYASHVWKQSFSGRKNAVVFGCFACGHFVRHFQTESSWYNIREIHSHKCTQMCVRTLFQLTNYPAPALSIKLNDWPNCERLYRTAHCYAAMPCQSKQFPAIYRFIICAV